VAWCAFPEKIPFSNWSDFMRILRNVISFGFVLSVTTLIAQTAPQQQTPPINPSTPATRVGDGAQSKAGTPVPSSATTPSTSGGVAGSATSSTTQSPDLPSSEGASVMSDSDLASQIQSALSKEPTLAGDSPYVTVSGDTIELAGAVNTNKEKITATRIVQSYAANKKLVNKLTIGKK
jgi:hypothetical protein